MGIDGMSMFLREKKKTCFDQVDLVKIAAESANGITLLVDFNSILHDFYSKFIERKLKKDNCPYGAFGNGEYMPFYFLLTKIIESLNAAGVNTVWYVSGARGSCSFTAKHKMTTWKQRLASDVSRMRNMLLLAKRKTLKSSDINIRELALPPLLQTVMRQALRSAGCTVVQCAYGDAEYVIARDFWNRKYQNAYAILSDDTDFTIFAGARLIPVEYFDINDSMKLRDQGPVQLVDLCCYVTNADRMVTAVGLKSRAQLIDVAILCGNDFTKPFITHEFRRKCAARLHSVTDRAAFILQYGSLRACSAVDAEVNRRSDLRDAFEYSRAYYNLELDNLIDGGVKSRDSEESELRFRIESLRYPPIFMSIHKHAVFWSSVALCDPNLVTHASQLDALEVAFRPFRCILYRSLVRERPVPRVDPRLAFLLENESASNDDSTSTSKDTRVAEYLSSYVDPTTPTAYSTNAFPVWITVDISSEAVLPQFSDIDQIDLSINRRLFKNVVNRLIDTFSEQFRSKLVPLQSLNVYQVAADVDFDENRPERSAYVYMMLKLFLHMNRIANLCVNRDEFRALFCTAFASGDEQLNASITETHVRPTTRSLTISTWFQLVYHNVHLIASLLFLEDSHFPKVHTVFSGAVWTCFCSLVHNKMRVFLTDDQMGLIVETREAILKSKRRKYYDALIEEYFPESRD